MTSAIPRALRMSTALLGFLLLHEMRVNDHPSAVLKDKRFRVKTIGSHDNVKVDSFDIKALSANELWFKEEGDPYFTILNKRVKPEGPFLFPNIVIDSREDERIEIEKVESNRICIKLLPMSKRFEITCPSWDKVEIEATSGDSEKTLYEIS